MGEAGGAMQIDSSDSLVRRSVSHSGMVDLAGRTARHAIGQGEIGHPRQVLEAHPHRDRHAVAIDRVDAFGIAGILARQRRALGILHRLDA